MRQSRPQPLTVLLDTPRLHPLWRGSQLRAAHEAIWLRVVDPSLRTSCRLASLRGGTLSVVTSHATVAGQLRYLQRLLIQQLSCHEEFRGLQRLQITVGDLGRRVKPQHKPLPRISESTRQHLKEVADSLGNSELSGALLRLARHASETPASS